jgi:TolB-like protein/AraC-like DNA-binding protein/Tfp pilus assembly protein PilF
MTEVLTADQIFIRKLAEIVLANLEDEAFGVNDLARESGMSLHSLNRKLISIIKKTANQFIREVRLQKALEMLKSESLTANEIADKVGFSSAAYFNICFSEFFGFPPGKVKKEGLKISKENFLYNSSSKQNQKKPLRQAIAFLIPRILLICVFIVIAALLIFYIQDRRQSKAISKLEKSVAVLPFINDGPDQENTYFINGIMEEVLTNLQKIKDFRVLSRNSVEKFRNNTDNSTPEIAKKLGVNYIVEGEGQKYGNSYRLRVQLIRAAKEGHLWAESYEKEIRGTRDIYGTQSEIAQSIAKALEATITPEEKRLINNISTTDLTAYDFYQRGREELTKYWINNRNKEALPKAEHFFHTALKYDSAFAQAYSGLAMVYWGKHWNVKEYFSENFMDSVLILENRALSFNSQLPEAYTYKGLFYYFIGKPEQATEEFDKAININPNDWMAYGKKGEIYLKNNDFINTIIYLQKAASINLGAELPSLLGEIGVAYLQSGFPEKYKQYCQDRLKLDSDSLSYYEGLAYYEYFRSNFYESIEYARKAYSIDSTQVYVILSLGGDYEMLGRYKESLKYFKKWIELRKAMGVLTSFPSDIGFVYLQNGNKEEADDFNNETIKECNKVIELKRESQVAIYNYYFLAKVYAVKGEKDKACKNLRILNQIQPVALWLEMDMKKDPVFNSFRNEPEFQQIARDIEARYQAEHEKVRKWMEENKML